MRDEEKGQVNSKAAELYEEFFVPALFAEWPERMVSLAEVSAKDRVLDVACGTGVCGGHAKTLVGPEGEVVGLDPNEGMLAVGRTAQPELRWQKGVAEQLPFEDQSFDVVLCQFGLMFFEDRIRALQEMKRVLKPGGRMVVAVWASASESPGYDAMIALLQRLFGERIANALRAPFVLGEPEALRAVFDNAMMKPEIRTEDGTARFPSLESWVSTDVRAWTLADLIDDEQYALLWAEAQSALKQFVKEDGSVCFAAPAHLALVRAA